jgi:choice-of-anchor A domain-containing protein
MTLPPDIDDTTDLVSVAAGVAVRLRVDATTFNPANIHILSTNGASGTLTIYQVAGSVTMSGNPTVDSGRARNFWYYGLPGVTSVTFGGTSSFIGVIYAPEANLTLNGGGNNNGLIGSSITKSITMNGHYDFHFDQDLSSIGPTHYVVNSWQEL